MPDGSGLNDVARAALERGYSRSVENLQETITLTADGASAVQARLRDGFERAVKWSEEAVAFGVANAEAVVKSGQSLISGTQSLGHDIVRRAQARTEAAMATARSAAGARSVKEFGELAAAHVQRSFADTVSESGKLANATARLFEQATQPLTARFTAAMEAFGRAF